MIIILFFIPGILLSQAFYTDQDTAITEVYEEFTELLEAVAWIHYEGDSTTELAWEREIIEQPPPWSNYMCSAQSCAPPDQGYGILTFHPGDSLALSCFFNTNLANGSAQVSVRFFVPPDTSTLLSIVYQASMFVASTSLIPARGQGSLFPNPTQNHVTIPDYQNWNEAQIMDPFGKVLAIHLNPHSELGVHFLSGGQYYLILRNNRDVIFYAFIKI